VQALTPSQALATAQAMEPLLSHRAENLQMVLRAMDPGATRLKSGESARQFLQRWVVLDERAAENEKEWESILDKVGQQPNLPK
jgi:hypothetical protein